MRYKKFKNAEIEVSQLAVGTWAIGGQKRSYLCNSKNDRKGSKSY